MAIATIKCKCTKPLENKYFLKIIVQNFKYSSIKQKKIQEILNET